VTGGRHTHQERDMRLNVTLIVIGLVLVLSGLRLLAMAH
jgi:uncharacterized membrane protein